MLSEARIAAYQAPENLLAERVIMITGAGDGIGKTAALSCAQHGATVILAGRTVAKLEQVYDAIIASGGAEPVIYPIDLEGTSSEDYDQLCSHIDEQFGRLDGLLHNAGILGQRTPLNNYRSDVWEKVMQVNVTAGFLMTQALMPVLEKSDSASVVLHLRALAAPAAHFGVPMRYQSLRLREWCKSGQRNSRDWVQCGSMPSIRVRRAPTCVCRRSRRKTPAR